MSRKTKKHTGDCLCACWMKGNAKELARCYLLTLVLRIGELASRILRHSIVATPTSNPMSIDLSFDRLTAPKPKIQPNSTAIALLSRTSGQSEATSCIS